MSISLPYDAFTLDNGLRVIVHEDHRAPVACVDVWYHVGSLDEKRGRTGFAHLFEHLMFMGTPAVPDIDVAYGAVGVEANASTWDDHTLYYARGMSSALPLILSVEADRMANQGAGISKDTLWSYVVGGMAFNEQEAPQMGAGPGGTNKGAWRGCEFR